MVMSRELTAAHTGRGSGSEPTKRAVRVITGQNAAQAGQVGAVVGEVERRPAGLRVIRVDQARSPRMGDRPGSVDPPPRVAPQLVGGAAHGPRGVLEDEPRPPVYERGGLGRHP